MFSGAEYVCCPRKGGKSVGKKLAKAAKDLPKTSLVPAHVDVKGFKRALKKFQRYLPLVKDGCDPNVFPKKQLEADARHKARIATLMEDWTQTQRRYVEL